MSAFIECYLTSFTKYRTIIAIKNWCCSVSCEKNERGETCLNATLQYLDKIAEKYDELAFASIYRFIKDNFHNTDLQNELLSIYKKCIKTESEYLNTHPKRPNKTWAPYLGNDDILELIFNFSVEDFLDIFKN
jgi:hypothetical protein